jgi:phospholipid transport system substrate-binding protein
MLRRAAALFCLCLPIAAFAAEPASVVDSFDTALLDAMKNAVALGPKGRFERLAPAMAEHFDLAAMTRDIAGAQWNHLSLDQRDRLVSAFSRFEAALFADWFDSYAGQSFQVKDIAARDDEIATIGVILPRGSAPLRLEYVLRAKSPGVWRIVDVRYDGWVSAVERRRSEFAELFNHYGFEGLMARLDAKGSELLDHSDNIAAPHLQEPLRNFWSIPIVTVY